METTEAMKLRVSTRDFADRPVPRALVEKIVTGGLYAPVGLKKFPELRLTVVENAALLARIDRECRRVPDVSPLHGAPVLIVVSTSLKGEIGALNASCLIENMLLAATDLGLANLYVRGIIADAAKDADFLSLAKIPAGFTPVASVAVGYALSPTEPREIPKNDVTKVDYLN